MRILVVTTWFPTRDHPSVGAFVARDVAALSARHDVRVLHLVAPHLADDGPATRTEILEAPGLEPADVVVRRVVCDLRRPDHLLRARRAVLRAAVAADVLHTMAFSSLLPLALGVRPALPWVHTEHWHGVGTLAGDAWHVRTLTPALLRALRRPHVVTAVSELATAPIRQLRGLRDTRVVPCVVVPPSPPPPRRPREDGTLRLVAVGGLIAHKGPDLAVGALARLRATGLDARLTWIGAGPERDPVLELASVLGVTEHVRLAGELEPPAVGDELAAADMFVLPTRRETFGVAIAEAVTHGRPVVVGKDGGQWEYLARPVSERVDVSGESGQAAADIADAVRRLDARTRDVSAQAIAGTIGSRFDAPHVVGAYEEAYLAAGASGVPRPADDDLDVGRDRVADVDGGLGWGAPQSGVRVVDVVIAVHTTDRPIARAVASVLENRTRTRVTVVCHGLAVEDVAPLLGDLTERARVRDHEIRLVPFADGVPSPSGPFNRGLDLARAPFVSIMGSDDTLEPGAIDSWVRLHHETGADVVLPRLVRAPAPAPSPAAPADADGADAPRGGSPHVPGRVSVVPTPPTRPGRRRDLDGVRDRLLYRSAPLGLMRRATLEQLRLRLAVDHPVGEDVPFSTRLFLECPVAYDRAGPAYVIGADAVARVTHTPRPVAADLAFLDDVLDAGWFDQLPEQARAAFATKAARIHLFGVVHNRTQASAWCDADVDALRSVAVRLAAAAPGYERHLSRADRDLLDAIGAGAPPARLVELSVRRRRHGTPATLLTRDLRDLLRREAPLRLMAASVLTR